MTRAAASPSYDWTGDQQPRVRQPHVQQPHVPSARLATEGARTDAAATVRARLAEFLGGLATVPASPQIVVLRSRAEDLDQAVAEPVRDRGEIDRRWGRLSDALARFCVPEIAVHGTRVAAIASSVALLR